MLSVGEPVTVQLRVLDWPAVSFTGLAVKLAMVGGVPTATATLAVAVPKRFVAVRIYDVDDTGLTLVDVPMTLPTPELMLRTGEPVTAQLSVVAFPGATLAGLAVKLAMVGGLPTVTAALAVAVPKELVAVRT